MIYIDILILAMIAIFILNRLRGVLGKKTGHETDMVNNLKAKRKEVFSETQPDKEVKVKNRKKDSVIVYNTNPKINDQLNIIKKMESSFNLEEFLSGAKNAFEYIINTYVKNDEKELEKFLSKNILNIYKNEIALRKKRNHKIQIEIIEIKEPVIRNVKVSSNNTATISLEYTSQQIQVTRDIDNNLVEGDPNQILDIKEIWVFSRKLGGKSPIWTLEEISDV